MGSNGNGLDLYDRKNDRFVSVLMIISGMEMLFSACAGG